MKWGKVHPFSLLGNRGDKVNFVTCLSNNVKSAIAKQMRTLLVLQLGLTHVQRSRSTQCVLELSISSVYINTYIKLQYIKYRTALQSQTSPLLTLSKTGAGTLKIGVWSYCYRLYHCSYAWATRGDKLAPLTVIPAFSHLWALGFAWTLSLLYLFVSNTSLSTPQQRSAFLMVLSDRTCRIQWLVIRKKTWRHECWSFPAQQFMAGWKGSENRSDLNKTTLPTLIFHVRTLQRALL